MGCYKVNMTWDKHEGDGSAKESYIREVADGS